METFVDAHPVADVNAGRGTDAADNPGTQIAHQVAIKVSHDQHVKLLGLQDHLHATVVHNNLTRLEFRKLARRPAECFQEQAVRELEDVGFVDTMDHSPPCRMGPLKCKAKEAQAGRLCHYFDALHDTRDD